MNPITYLKDTITELKQVRWPTRQETTRLTIIVVCISVFVALYIGALDFAFTNLLSFLLK